MEGLNRISRRRKGGAGSQKIEFLNWHTAPPYKLQAAVLEVLEKLSLIVGAGVQVVALPSPKSLVGDSGPLSQMKQQADCQDGSSCLPQKLERLTDSRQNNRRNCSIPLHTRGILLASDSLSRIAR